MSSAVAVLQLQFKGKKKTRQSTTELIQSSILIIQMFHSIAERPNTEHKFSFTYNTLGTQGWNVKAKNELPETAYLPMALDT